MRDEMPLDEFIRLDRLDPHNPHDFPLVTLAPITRRPDVARAERVAEDFRKLSELLPSVGYLDYGELRDNFLEYE